MSGGRERISKEFEIRIKSMIKKALSLLTEKEKEENKSLINLEKNIIRKLKG